MGYIAYEESLFPFLQKKDKVSALIKRLTRYAVANDDSDQEEPSYISVGKAKTTWADAEDQCRKWLVKQKNLILLDESKPSLKALTAHPDYKFLAGKADGIGKADDDDYVDDADDDDDDDDDNDDDDDDDDYGDYDEEDEDEVGDDDGDDSDDDDKDDDDERKVLIEVKRTNQDKPDFLTPKREKLKKRHNYYYQVQGLMEIFNLDKCYFIVQKGDAPQEPEIIKRKQDFFNNDMLGKLNAFYFNHFLPAVMKKQEAKDKAKKPKGNK